MAPLAADKDSTGQRDQVRAFRSPAAWVILLVVIAAGLAADLYSKSWAFRSVTNQPIVLDRQRLLAEPDYDPIQWHETKRAAVWGILDLKLVLNPGAVFGVGANQRWFFIVFTFLAISAGLIGFGRYTTRSSRLAHLAIGLVLAGGLGNLYDRMTFGRVRDFLHMFQDHYLPNGWTWPGTNNPELFPWVFNVADVLLLLGMILLMIHISRVEKRRKYDQVEAPGADAAALTSES